MNRFKQTDWWRLAGEYVPNEGGTKTFSGAGAVLIRCELEPHGILQLWFPASCVADGPDGIYVQTWLIRKKNEEFLKERRPARLHCECGKHGTGDMPEYSRPTAPAWMG